jgi:acyl phosphate:glycerol-3-phosphate acyltransferase
MAPLIWLALSYVIGSFPTSFLAARIFRGIDLREHGSRNLGATNVYRMLGWRYALPVGLIDILKGAVPVWLFGARAPDIPLFPLLCGLAAVVGHVFSIFVGFKGGKGVATAAGVVLAVAPWGLLAVTIVWALLVRFTGYVSLASVASAVLFPLAAWLLHESRGLELVAFVALAGFIVWKHRANLRRLAAGTESRFGKGREGAGTAGNGGERA